LLPGIGYRIVDLRRARDTILAILRALQNQDSPITQCNRGGIPPCVGHLRTCRPRLREWIEDVDVLEADIVIDVASHYHNSSVGELSLPRTEQIVGRRDIGEGIG